VDDGMKARSPGARPWRRALAWLLFLGPFFFLTYGLANWAAARHAVVPALAFGWERAIPFWAWTIVPYWSIDLLYGLSLFVCISRGELDAHAKRLLTAQFFAVTCFVAAPHRFSFDRPRADGVFGTLFDALAGFDLPYNQIPSLHIALAVILWVLYARELRGVARILLDVWFMLIGASVLTTYQHHFVDIPTGFALGWLCVWLWPLPADGVATPASAWRYSTDPARHRLALRYAAGALACLVAAIGLGGAALWLLWGTLALGLVAACYVALGPAGFQKNEAGRLTPAARWLMAPYLAAAWLNSRWWTRRQPAPAVVADDVWIGRMPSRDDASAARFAAIVDLTAELGLPAGPQARAVIPVLDLTAPAPAQLAAAATAIERLRSRGPVLVCCALGLSRSASAVAAWLLATGRAPTVEAALARVRAARAAAVFTDRHVAALRAVRPV
jgi:protein-tyrosine phosphatase/membrane-associated phospholipid phosphatase